MSRRLLLALLLAAAAALPAWAASPPLVAVVYGEYSYQSAPQGEGASAKAYCDTVRQALAAAHISYTLLNDAAVETGGLLPYRVAIFPYNFVVPDAEQQAILRYLEGGGKAVFCYAVPERVASALGFRTGAHQVGSFETLRIDAARLPGAPPRVTQDSWNVMPIQVQRPQTVVVGEWLDPAGAVFGPGLVLSPQGAYLGHVLTETDMPNKARLLLALLGALAPEVPARVSADAVAAARRDLAHYASARQDVDFRYAAGLARAKPLLDQAQECLEAATQLAKTGRAAEATANALDASNFAARSFTVSAAERGDEMRGVWLHGAYGVRGWGWERTARTACEAGLNALIVNQLWAGVAHYPSEVLPVAPRVATEGDQIAEALRWCRQYDLELHIWKVNYNLQNASPDFVDKLRGEGRLQRHRNGSEITWLCPSDPRNFALERDSMLEVVRKYPVDGIHFDYIRYPHGDACYCDGCRSRFQADSGVTLTKWPDDVLAGPFQERFQQWHRDQVTRLVRAVSAEAHRLRPGIQVSAAVFGWPYNAEVGQDWKRWVEEDLLDFVCPMNYTESLAELANVVPQEVNVVNGRVPLYIGLGEYVIRNTADLAAQIEEVRDLGADGFVLFSLESLGPNAERLADLHAALTAHAARPPHPAPRVRFAFEREQLEEGEYPRFFFEGPDPLTGEVTLALTTEGNYPEPIRRAWGRVQVEATDGRVCHSFGSIASDGPPRTVSLWDAERLPMHVDPLRLVVRGTVALASGATHPFISRSRIVSYAAE